MAIVRPSPENMTHLSEYMYLPFRAACLNNFIVQLFPERRWQTTDFSHKTTSKDIAADRNVQKMLEATTAHGMFHNVANNKGLWNILEPREA